MATPRGQGRRGYVGPFFHRRCGHKRSDVVSSVISLRRPAFANSTMQHQDHDLCLAVYQHADHGLVETISSGEVTRPRYPASLPPLIVQWIVSEAVPPTDG